VHGAKRTGIRIRIAALGIVLAVWPMRAQFTQQARNNTLNSNWQAGSVSVPYGDLSHLAGIRRGIK